jgi:hypothetical protein
MKLAKAKARRATARGKLPPPPPMAPAPPAPARSAAADAPEEAVDGAAPAPRAAVNISLPLMPLALSRLPSLPRLVRRRLGRDSRVSGAIGVGASATGLWWRLVSRILRAWGLPVGAGVAGPFAWEVTLLTRPQINPFFI